MEKFTKFRDPGTGIAPFLPIAPGSRTPLIIPFELTLCVIRLALIILVFGLHVILVEGLGELCLRRVLPSLLGWIRWLFLRTLIFLCGIWWIDEQLDGVSKSYTF
jgi:1-acylglycerol-3-phosphate O-acyltransferase